MAQKESGEKQASPADRIRKWRYKPGQSGNLKGRPKSPVTRIKEIWKENPEDFDEWVKDYMEKEKKHVVEMVEGKPKQQVAVAATLEINDLRELSDEELNKLIEEGVSGEGEEGEVEETS